jgi:hypothetical protein
MVQHENLKKFSQDMQQAKFAKNLRDLPFCEDPSRHSGTEVVLVREGPKGRGGLLTAEKGF